MGEKVDIDTLKASLEAQRAKLDNLEKAAPWEIERLQEVIANLELSFKEHGQPIPERIQIKEEDNMTINARARHRYYEEHKDEIISDLLSTGKADTMRKWNIPGGATIYQLMKRWLTPEQIGLIPGARRAKSSFSIATMPNIMPKFPEFKDTWEREVQIRWLELYVELKGQSNGGDKS